ncbi:hypothetical protein [Pseudoruegeria sp. HB172150]|uniref:hypothetical protein n=1 Tax=Pseudoruegeria sp. HB172150 TaxID=2721164 RepID=UPI001556DBBF|nr:hypothetical protein [Pseudoruegeria sp. HB172150]
MSAARLLSALSAALIAAPALAQEVQPGEEVISVTLESVALVPQTSEDTEIVSAGLVSEPLSPMNLDENGSVQPAEELVAETDILPPAEPAGEVAGQEPDPFEGSAGIELPTLN